MLLERIMPASIQSLTNKNVPAARVKAGGGHEGRSIQPLNDGTIDGETAGRERCATRLRNEAILDESQNLELFTQLALVSLGNCILGPRVQLHIPGRRVIQGLGRYAAQDVVGTITVRQVG